MWPVKSLRGPDGLPDMEALIQAGGLMSSGHGVGSFVLVDAVTANIPSGTLTSLYSTNSTAFLLQNVEFYNIEKAIMAERRADPILAGGGGNDVLIDAWGFGLYAQDADPYFLQQRDIQLFTRRRPQYADIGHSQVFDVTSHGAKGDGVTDDTINLNSVFTVAVNLSSIVYIPHGVYKVTDTLKIPKGSRIIGQAWSQIMATGPKFQDADDPHVAVQVPPLELSWWNEISMNQARGRQDYGDPIDVFSARGILVESHGPTWMYGTASEHNVLYQYQLPGAQKIVMGMIQTETPYFQPLPAAPEPFKPAGCAMAWAVRIINSSTVYILGSGLYSWLAFYTQDCLETGNCQEQGFYVEQSTNTWVYNLVTKGVTESISPAGETPLYARDVRNGYTSSLLAWLHTGTGAIGKRKFPGFYLWDGEMDRDVLSGVSSTCKASLTRLVECHDQVYMLRALQWRGSMHNDTLTDLMCDKTCGQSLQLWFESVLAGCAREQDHVVLAEPGGIIWAGWNETCVKDPNTGKYCGDAINEFTVVRSISDMPHSELCSYCYVTRYKMMQATPYSIYDKTYQSDLEFIHSKCGLSGPTSILPPLQEFPDP
ncbi:hypothetical protein KXX25_009265 [Aspergillus fumigatus]|nr:hypothetical protein KXX25_009265 [Aspergillus fumigatus]KAH2092657.1 hypothetical protein KXW86_005142 [Aspergillus fumigatus]